MRNLIYFTLVFYFSCNIPSQEHFDIEIGRVENGTPVITTDLDNLKTNWTQFLVEHSGLDSPSIDNVSITTNDNGQYILFGNDALNSLKSVINLVNDDNRLYEARIDGGGKTLTCSGCTRGCDPGMDDKERGICTDCTNEGKCTKTISVSLRSSIIRTSIEDK